VTGGGHGRRLRTLGRKNAPPVRNVWMEAVHENARRDNAVRALVALALQLAGTDKLPLRAPVGGGNAPTHVPAPPPPRVPRPTEGRVWTKDIRPGPHDVLTWEEAMQVPWYDPFAEGEC
jgi:hypothetical protein